MASRFRQLASAWNPPSDEIPNGGETLEDIIRMDDGQTPGVDPLSPKTRELVDSEVRRIVEECNADVIVALQANRDKLDALTEALVQHETLDEVDIYRVVGIDRSPVRA